MNSKQKRMFQWMKIISCFQSGDPSWSFYDTFTPHHIELSCVGPSRKYEPLNQYRPACEAHHLHMAQN